VAIRDATLRLVVDHRIRFPPYGAATTDPHRTLTATLPMIATISSWHEAFAHPVTVWIILTVIGALTVACAVIGSLSLTRSISSSLRRELWLRLGSWAIMAPLIIAPILAGRMWTIGAVAVLAMACLREYDRATGLFRDRLVCLVVVLGILAE